MSLILHPVLSFTILKDPINNLCLPFDYRVVSMTISVMTVLVIPPALLTMWWCPRQWSRPPTWWPPSLSILREPPFAASILLPPPPLSSTDTPKPITRSSTWHSNQKNIKSWRKERIVAALSAPHKKSQPASKKYFSIFFYYIYSISTQYWLPSLKMTKWIGVDNYDQPRYLNERHLFAKKKIICVALNKDLMRLV